MGQRRSAPPRVAVIGAGPSGLFAAQALVANHPQIRVDIFDRLPSPFGLLRYGVAPDHESIKSVADALARIFEDKRITFRGLVEFGTHITRDDLLGAYDAVIYAAGASEDQRLNVPGEYLPGSRSAREFVAWYSGHPDAPPQDLSGVEAAATLGVGNVAVDVARMLVKRPEALDETDMPQAVLAELHRHQVKDVWVIGRRGPQHASFTTPELRELLNTDGVQVSVSAEVYEPVPEAQLDRRTRANIEALLAAAAREVPNPRVRLHFLFWRRPVSIDGQTSVTGITLEGTRVDDSGNVVGTGNFTHVDVQLVLRAIGYKGVPLLDVPFDARAGVIPNDEGRVLADGQPSPGEYVVGWIKRGPIGVIGTNKSDANQTVGHLLADLAANPRPPKVDVADLLASRGLQPSSFSDWERIEQAERVRGAARGRARTKIEAWHELLDLVKAGETAGGSP